MPPVALPLPNSLRVPPSGAAGADGLNRKFLTAIQILAAGLLLLSCWLGTGWAVAEEPRDAAADSYFAANALYNRKLYQMAEEEFRDFLNRHGGHEKAENARLGLALSLYGQGKYEEAEPLLAALGEKEREARLLQAQCLLELGKPEEAEAAFADARRRAGGDRAFEARALGGLVATLSALENWPAAADRAKDLIDRTEDKSPAQLRVRYQRGAALYEQGKFREAADELARAADAVSPEENPLYGRTVLLLGESLREAGEPEEGARRLDQAAREGGAEVAADALFRLVYLRFEQQRHDDAIRAFEQLQREHADSPLAPRAAVFAGRAASGKNDFRRAKAILEPLREHPETGPEASYWLGLSLVEDNKHDEAVRIFADAERRFPDDPRTADLAFERALLAMGRGEFADAAAIFERLADEEFPRSTASLRFAATARYQLGEFAETLTLCEKFDQLEEGQITESARGDMAYLRADSLFRSGEADQAAEALEAFVEKYPQHASHDAALHVLASVSEAAGDRPQAIAALDRLIRDHSESERLPAALASLGQLRHAEGDRRGARAALERLARDFSDAPERATGDYLLGFIAQDEGKTGEAATWFGGMADRFPEHELASDARLQQASALLGDDGRGETGLAALERFARDYREDARAADALYRAGMARFEREEWQLAADSFSTLVSRAEPTEFHARALYRLAWAQRGLEEFAKAAETYRRLLREVSDDPIEESAAVELAELSDDSGEVVGLLEERIPRLTDDHVRERAQFALGTAYLARGDTLAAAKAYEAAGAGDLAKLGAGEARLRLQEYAKAADHLAAVTANGPLAARARVRLGEALALMERWDESVNAYRSALRQEAEGELARHARFGIAWATENQGDRRRAINLYRELVESGERDEAAARSQFQIGECLFAEGEFDAAIREFIRVDNGYPFDQWRARAILELGRALERTGALEDSAARYREVIERFPESDAAPVAKDLLQAIAGS